MTSPLSSRHVTVQGTRVPVIEGGPSTRDAVVFVHGNPGSGRDWTSLAGAVSRFARVIAPDMPGFGQADKRKDFDYTVPGYATFLGALLDQLGVARAHLVLHDFGGPWGLVWAAAHRERFASVVLINTGVLPGYRWHYLARIWRTPILGELSQAMGTRKGFHMALGQRGPRPLPAAYIDQMWDDYDWGTRRAVLRLYRATDDPGRAAGALSAALAPLRRPGLVVWGRRDPYIGAEYAERQREVFDAGVVMLDESGHWPFADDAAAVEAAVVPFLRVQTAGAR